MHIAIPAKYLFFGGFNICLNKKMKNISKMSAKHQVAIVTSLVIKWSLGIFLLNKRPNKPSPIHRTRMLQDKDPCLISNMTECILPLIPLRTRTITITTSNKGTKGLRYVYGTTFHIYVTKHSSRQMQS